LEVIEAQLLYHLAGLSGSNSSENKPRKKFFIFYSLVISESASTSYKLGTKNYIYIFEELILNLLFPYLQSDTDSVILLNYDGVVYTGSKVQHLNPKHYNSESIYTNNNNKQNKKQNKTKISVKSIMERIRCSHCWFRLINIYIFFLLKKS